MKIFTVFTNKPIEDFFNDPIYIEEKFSFSAAIFNILWAVYNRMWRSAIFILLIYWLLYLLNQTIHISDSVFYLLCLGIATYIGSNAKDWYAYSLISKGYKLQDVILARDLDEAQLQFIRSIQQTSYDE